MKFFGFLGKIIKWIMFMATTSFFLVYLTFFIAIWCSEGVIEAIETMTSIFKMIF